ncbi:uncharacterized protein LOC123541377 [Mercenaria mercenaria]|uniref:uncharacterized protein LOC123541377 n=1 Tax=Mercenaria mercenaria TaxID=6596 RepID=UPI00234F8F63|nr:uncharacterized protein LOC123541377 [Mercenaria mercenaria]XP_045182771.2 uncharacterized protein LOC123541377 [Mercenaria mercenaria]
MTVATTQENSTSTDQFEHNTGGTEDDPVSIYILVPVVIIVAVALVVMIIVYPRRKRRLFGDNICFHRKEVTNNRKHFIAATNITYVGSLRDDETCIKCFPESVRNSAASSYDEINISTTPPIKTSETVFSTVSVGLPQERFEKGATESSDTYDTLQTSSKTNKMKSSDCSKTIYNHVVVGNHTSDTDEYSHTHAVQINNSQPVRFKVTNDHSLNCDNKSNGSDDQDDHSEHEYVILEPNKQSIIKK